MSGDETGQLVYYVILAALIGSGLLAGQRLGWGKAARYAAVWLAIMAVLLVLYSFRETFSPVKDRAMAELVPERGFEAGAGQTYVARNDGHFYIASTINGVDVTFLVDTGATDIVLSRIDAARIGLKLTDSQFSGTVSTANGTVRSARLTVERLTIGPFNLGQQTISVTDGPLDVSLAGMAALRQFGSVELRGDRLILMP
jgi:aspartyl protease family protein